jgi:hypothetical protein
MIRQCAGRVRRVDVVAKPVVGAVADVRRVLRMTKKGSDRLILPAVGSP